MDTLHFIDPPACLLAPLAAQQQPPLLDAEGTPAQPLRLRAAIASLALGGAEHEQNVRGPGVFVSSSAVFSHSRPILQCTESRAGLK